MPLEKALPAHRNQDLKGVDYNDNTQLMFLHAASLLNNLRLRYQKDLIYVKEKKQPTFISLSFLFVSSRRSLATSLSPSTPSSRSICTSPSS